MEAKEVLILLLGSGGLIVGLIPLFTYLSARLDARRLRKKEEAKTELSNSADIRRLELDSTSAVQTELWGIIEAQKEHIRTLENELSELDKKAVLQRPAILNIYANIRAIRAEIESLGVMALDDAATQIFMKRFNAVKCLLDETEKILP